MFSLYISLYITILELSFADDEIQLKATFPPDDDFKAITDVFPEKGKLETLKCL